MSVSREREAGQALSAVDARGLRRALLHWLTVVVVLVSVFSSVVNWVFVDREPQDPVATWLGGLENGRSRQLLSRTEAVVSDPTLSIFSNRVYRNAAGRIGGHEIVGVDRSGSRAEIRARVWWDGPDGAREREEVHVYPVHQVRRSGPFNDQWLLDDPDVAALSIHLPAPLDELSVNGEAVRPDADERAPDPQGPGGTWRYEALPGEYAIGLPESSYYAVDPSPVSHTVAFRDPSPATVALRIEPSPRMWQEVDDRIEAWLEDCMASEELSSEECPSSRRWASPQEPLEPSAAVTGAPEPEVTGVRWRLVSRPALVLVPDPADPLRWTADPHRPAEARLSYEEDGETVTERIEFPVRATVRSTGQSADVEVGLDRPGGSGAPAP